MNSFERFKNRNSVLATAAQKEFNRQFILKGYPSIEINNHNDTTKKIMASVVNKQEKEMAYIYTSIDEPLEIGSVWDAKGLRLLVNEEIIVIKDVKWHKYKALICNVEIEGHPAYLLGPEKSYIATALELKTVIESRAKPILVMPLGTDVKIGTKIVIKNRAWLVQECDDYSTEGIGYYSLSASTVSSHVEQEAGDKQTYLEQPSATQEDFVGVLQNGKNIRCGHNVEVSIPCDETVTWDNRAIKVIKRTNTTITFILPFGVDEVNFSNGYICRAVD